MHFRSWISLPKKYGLWALTRGTHSVPKVVRLSNKLELTGIGEIQNSKTASLTAKIRENPYFAPQ
jgi:hypothetical protein